MSQIDDTSMRVEAINIILDSLYDSCITLNDHDLTKKLEDIKTNIPTDIDSATITNKMEKIISKKMAYKMDSFGHKNVYPFAEIIPHLKLLEDEIEKKVGIEFNLIKNAENQNKQSEDTEDQERDYGFNEKNFKKKIVVELGQKIGNDLTQTIPDSNVFNNLSIDLIAYLIKGIEIGAGRTSGKYEESKENDNGGSNALKPFSAFEVKVLIIKIENRRGKRFSQDELVELIKKIEEARNIKFSDKEKITLKADNIRKTEQSPESLQTARVFKLLQGHGILQTLTTECSEEELTDRIKILNQILKSGLLENIAYLDKKNIANLIEIFNNSAKKFADNGGNKRKTIQKPRSMFPSGPDEL